MGKYTYVLFARPSFLEGMAPTLDVGGTMNAYNYSPSDRVADYRALRSDWSAVGADLWQAVRALAKDLPKVPSGVGR